MQKLYCQKVSALRKLSLLEDDSLKAFSVLSTGKVNILVSDMLENAFIKKEDSFKVYLSRLSLEGYLSDSEEMLLFNLYEIKKQRIADSTNIMEEK